MQITGHKIRAALRKLRLQRKTAANRFSKTLYAFEDEDKPHPDDVMRQLTEAEDRIASLQELQGRYNLAVMVAVQGTKMSLHRAVKRIGAANRAEKQWLTAADETPKRRGYYAEAEERKRSVDDIYAKRVLTVEECTERALEASKYAAALREAIELGNATPVELEVSSELFGE